MAKMGKNLAQREGQLAVKCKFYRLIGKTFKYLREFRLAFIYFFKGMKLCLLLGHQRYEMEIYDHVGEIYALLGQPEKASFFHHWPPQEGQEEHWIARILEQHSRRIFTKSNLMSVSGPTEISSSEEENDSFFEECYIRNTKDIEIRRARQGNHQLEAGPNRCLDSYFRRALFTRFRIETLPTKLHRKFMKKLAKLRRMLTAEPQA
jgi:hypothetical protein